MKNNKSTEVETIKDLKKIAIVTPGYKPVPDVSGGAVEHLITHIILQNEINPKYYFYLFTVYEKKLELYTLKFTKFIFTKKWRKNFFKRSFSFILNYFFKISKSNFRFNFMANEIARNIPVNVDLLLMENDLDILRALKPKLNKLPIIFHLHNDFDTFNEKQKTSASMNWTIRNVDKIWVVSNYLEQHIKTIFPFAKVDTFENCIDSENYKNTDIDVSNIKNSFDIKDNDFIILYSGRIIQQKGILELIKACTYLPENIQYKLIIVGDTKSAPKKYLKQLYTSAEKIKNKVIFTGYVPHNKMQLLYYISDIVVIPSLWQEAFCLSALEAVCNSKPCIASRSGALINVLNSSCADFIDLTTDFSKNLSQSIYRLYKDENLRIEMSKNALIHSKHFLNEKQYFDRFCYLTNKFFES